MTPRLPWLSLIGCAALALAGCDDTRTTQLAPADAAPPDAAPAPDEGARDAGPEPDPDPDPDPDPGACVTDAEHFAAEVVPVITDCAACHTDGGPASVTRYVLVPFADDAAITANHQRLVAALETHPDLGALLVDKPTNVVGHGGGRRFDVGSPQARALAQFVERTRDPADCMMAPAPAVDPCATGLVTPGRSTLRRLTDAQYTATVRDVFGVEVPDGLFPATIIDREFRTWPINNTVTGSGVESVMLAAEHIARRLDTRPLLTCQDEPNTCGQRAALGLAARAYRRPLREAERALIEQLFTIGLSPDEALRTAVELIAQSPQFLYLDDAAGEPVPAIDPAAPDAETRAAPLDPHALAARLSYFLTDSAPDDALRAAADAGELTTREQIAAHARRLLTSPRISRPLTAFHRDWIDSWRVRSATRDPERYPSFGPHVIESMLTELDLYVTEVVWSGDARFDTLLFGDATWVDSTLAPLYGLDDPGPGWHRVRLGPERPGILTRTAFLAGHAYAQSSSPIQRGAFVLHDMLCESLSPPQDINMDLPEPSAEAPTIRERLQQHWTSPTCRACHDRIDPIGLSFEHFGALGEWRDTWDDGTPVDALGVLPEPAGEFYGAAEMLDTVGRLDDVRACYTRRWFEYAVGRPADASDTCTLDRLAERFEQTDGDIRSLLVDITLTDAFRYRAVEGGN